ncbi:MAG TPA: hypothetical protein PKC28_00860 [Bdellovibrionales bacterium]|nr:hypothetical protein [Bdellovibrionales bacterium]
MDMQLVAGLFLPILLVLIMFSLGLGLTVADFQRVALQPYPVVIGLTLQMVILPAVAFALCLGAGLSPAFSIGLVLLAASPGAPTANLYTKIAGADLPLNISLTAVNTLLNAATMPIVAALAVSTFANPEDAASLSIPASRTFAIFLLIVVPVTVGILINRYKPALALTLDKPARVIVLIGLAIIIIGGIVKEWSLINNNIGSIGWVILVFNIVSLGIAYFGARLLRVREQSSVAIMFGSGVHNASIPFYVAITVLGSTEIAIPIAFYSILMYLTALAVAIYIKRSA